MYLSIDFRPYLSNIGSLHNNGYLCLSEECEIYANVTNNGYILYEDNDSIEIYNVIKGNISGNNFITYSNRVHFSLN